MEFCFWKNWCARAAAERTKLRACSDYWLRTTAKTWRGRWSARPGTALSPGFWRHRRARARCRKRLSRRRKNNSRRSSAKPPYRRVPRQSIRHCWKNWKPAMKKTTTIPTNQLRDQCLRHCSTLAIPLEPAALDESLSQAEKENLSHLQFLDLLLGAQANARRERSIARRIREAHFAENKTLEGFDWNFNPRTFDRV